MTDEIRKKTQPARRHTFLLMALAMEVFVYLAFVFWMWEFNPGAWPEYARFLFGLMTGCVVFGTVVVSSGGGM